MPIDFLRKKCADEKMLCERICSFNNSEDRNISILPFLDSLEIAQQREDSLIAQRARKNFFKKFILAMGTSLIGAICIFAAKKVGRIAEVVTGQLEKTKRTLKSWMEFLLPIFVKQMLSAAAETAVNGIIRHQPAQNAVSADEPTRSDSLSRKSEIFAGSRPLEGARNLSVDQQLGSRKLKRLADKIAILSVEICTFRGETRPHEYYPIWENFDLQTGRCHRDFTPSQIAELLRTVELCKRHFIGYRMKLLGAS